MNVAQKVSWNKEQAQKNGWTPNLWGCSDFNEQMIQNISDFQKNLDCQ